ncbi:AMP-binding protein [Nocardia sp. NPDC024068]|uniref:AMP-binding protein n=1 Tax=Nocardia sp. NPDC024068 TaxID=3157197 RepID=UPI0033E97EC2
MSTPAVIRCGSQIRTHTEIRDRAARLAAALAELGLGYEDRYAIVMRNEIGFVEATLAGAALGAIPVPVNWHWTGDDLAYLLTDSDSRIVLAHTDLLPAVEAVLPPGATIVEAPVPQTLAEAYGFHRPALTTRYADTDELIGSHEPHTGTVPSPPLSVIYTSGTTGRPKGILRQPVAPQDTARLGELVVAGLGVGTARSTLVAAPLYHTAPNIHVMFTFAMGIDVEIMPRFHAEGLLRVVQDRKIEHLQAVPTMFHRLLKLPAHIRESYDISSLTGIVHAAAPCPPEVKRAIIEWFGPIVHEYYGGSETGAAVLCDSAQWLAHPGTVGRALGDSEVRILGTDGRELPPGTPGDIYIKPFSIWPDFTYLGNDAERRAIEKDGFLTVGDIGYLDEEGFLYLSDRRNDMVISGGVNIYPAEIESCLHGLEGVADVAVFGIPDPEFGEALAAHVQLAPGATLGVEAIRAHVAHHLAKYKVPKVVVLEGALPREDTGKLFKRELKAPYWGSRADA